MPLRIFELLVGISLVFILLFKISDYLYSMKVKEIEKQRDAEDKKRIILLKGKVK